MAYIFHKTQEAMLFFLLLIQIITESLPISSSGHVALVSLLLQKHGYDVAISKELLLAVHGITAIIMLAIMRRSWLPLLYHPWRMRTFIFRMALYGLCAELITALLYYSLHDSTTHWHLAWGFFITAIALYSASVCSKFFLPQSSLFIWSMAGIAQGLAVVPGCSRLALTYAVVRWCGYTGRHAFLLSCTLAVPPFIMASLYGLYSFCSPTRCVLLPIATMWYYILFLFLASYIAYKALLFSYYCMATDRTHYFSWYLLLVLFIIACYC